MQTPPRITFRRIDPSPALEHSVYNQIDRLERFHKRITACHVVIDAPTAHHINGGAFVVSVELMVPGGVINAGAEHAANSQPTDVYVALHDAFDSARRQLQEFERSR